MRYLIQYGLYEDPSFEGEREFISYEAIETFLSVMEGLLSYCRIYDEKGNEIIPSIASFKIAEDDDIEWSCYSY